MDKQIRDRLMAMPGEYTQTGQSLRYVQGRLLSLRREHEKVKADIMAETAKKFPEKSNKEFRDAMMDEALASDSGLQVLAVEIQSFEDQVKAFSFNLEALKFERDCLGLVVNNDHMAVRIGDPGVGQLGPGPLPDPANLGHDLY